MEVPINTTTNHSYYSNIQNSVRIAVVGCLHGNLKDVYDELAIIEKNTQTKVDILLCCGDFESMRNEYDLQFMSCPEKYKHLTQFMNYDPNGEFFNQPAPYLTIFIGGNHEASNVLDENFYGGWVAYNIFYLGRAGVVNFRGLRIAGLSGIYNKFDYCRGHFEMDLLKNIKSIFHVREYEIAKLAQLKSKIDILMTHDWPSGCVNRKDFNKITKVKYHWKEELKTNTLGSPASEYLMKLLKPSYLLSGHMHYTYFNDIKHSDSETTKFIALDKAGTKGKRYYLHILDYPGEKENNENNERNTSNDLFFDPEWLAITKAFNDYMPTENKNYDFSAFMPSEDLIYSGFFKNQYQTKPQFDYRSTYTKVTPAEDIKDKITKNTSEFKKFNNKALTINYSSDKDYMIQRENFVKFIQIEDIHKTKGKVVKNTEEINLDFEF